MKSDIRTIAANTGFSIATVSRVLSGGGYAAPATRSKIMAEALRLGRRTERKTILFIAQSSLLDSSYFTELLRRLWEDFERDGFRCELVDKSSLDVVEDRLISGAIAMMTVDGLERYWGESFTVPLVCINSGSNRLDNVWSVLTDEYDGMAKLLDHLRKLGHRRILFLSPPPNANNYCSRTRRRAFEELTAKMDLEYAPVIDIVWDKEEFGITAKRIMQSPVTAVIIGGEERAAPLIWYLRSFGCRVPGDISVCAWDINAARTSDIPVTIVAQDLENLASAAARSLRKLMAGEKLSDNILIPCRFYPRMSTGPAPVNKGAVPHRDP